MVFVNYFVSVCFYICSHIVIDVLSSCEEQYCQSMYSTRGSIITTGWACWDAGGLSLNLGLPANLILLMSVWVLSQTGHGRLKRWSWKQVDVSLSFKRLL